MPEDIRRFQAESELFASILMSPQLFDRLNEIGFSAKYLHEPADRELYNALLDKYTKKQEITLSTLLELNVDTTRSNRIIASYAEVFSPEVFGTSAARALKSAETSNIVYNILAQAADSVNMNTDDTNEVVEKVITDLREATADEIAETKVDIIPAIERDLDRIHVITTGHKRIDWMVKGIEGGAFWIVGAETSHGKTMFALNVAHKVLEATYRVNIFTAEMGDKPLIMRLATMQSGINPSIEQIQGEERERYLSACRYVQKMPLKIIKTSSLSTIAMCMRRYPASLNIVDYIQLIKPFQYNPSGGDTSKLGDVARDLEILSKELDTCIICTCQYNRPKEGSTDPHIHRLRGSGEIEESADHVMLMYYPFQDATQEKKESLLAMNKEGVININIVKNRLHSLIGMTKLWFDRRTCRMTDYEQEE